MSTQSPAKPRLLLHICCAPCATYPYSVLAAEYDVTAYFYDPNIHPESEYIMRRDEAVRYFVDKCPVIVGEYDVKNWFQMTEGLDSEPEKGKRCTICYDMRIREAGRYAAENRFQYFATVLSVSPHKDVMRINASGVKAGEQYGITYVVADWKKGNGTKKGIDLAKASGLIRQDYCGCVYSRLERDKRHASRR